MTISAVSFLANAKTKPVSLIIEQFNAQGNYEIAAVIAIIILVVNITMKTIVHFTTGAIRNRAKKASVAR
jgi:ABC-type Fe3+ transport system permease subunit